jgi:ATP-dependent Clp protease protease subunit
MKAILNMSPLIKEMELRYKPIIITVNEFTEKSAKEFSALMSVAHNTGQKVIPIVIDSYGGQVYSLMRMISEIRSSKIPVATIVQGKAMSCGAVLTTFGAPGMRYMDPDATLMIHDVASGMWGKVAELKADVAEAERLNEVIFSMMDKNCGQAEGFFMKKLKKKDRADWYLTPKRCKKYNIVNHTKVPHLRVNVTCDIDLK